MKVHFWYTMFSLFFAALFIVGYGWLWASGRLLASISFEDFALIALATMRLVRLFTYDIITQFIRDWFVGAKPDSFRGTLGALLGCPWCTGLWFAMMLVFLYCAFPIVWYFILVLAVAAVATFLQLLTNFVGWSAEVKKKEAGE